jgi:hypothetical protein
MNKRRYLNIICVILLISLLNCKKKSEVNTRYIPNILKEFAFFKPGSFWIYLNEASENMDSSFIIKNPEFTYNQNGGYSTDEIFEECVIRYEGGFIYSTTLGHQSYTIRFPRFGFEAINATTFTPDQTFQLNGSTTLKYFPLVDSMVINNIIFHDVFITQWQWINSLGDTFRNTSYFVKKVGLIKFIHKEPNSDTTWHLLRYHTIQ